MQGNEKFHKKFLIFFDYYAELRGGYAELRGGYAELRRDYAELRRESPAGILSQALFLRSFERF